MHLGNRRDARQLSYRRGRRGCSERTARTADGRGTILRLTLYERGTHPFQLVVEPGQLEVEIVLPSPPTKRPVEEGKAISGAYFSHLLKHHVRGVRATNRGTRTGGSGSLIRISYTLSYCVQY